MISVRVLAGNFSLLIFVLLCLALKWPSGLSLSSSSSLKWSLQEFSQTSPQIDFQVLNNIPPYNLNFVHDDVFPPCSG